MEQNLSCLCNSRVELVISLPKNCIVCTGLFSCEEARYLDWRILMALDIIIVPITTSTHFKTPRGPIRRLEHMEIG